MKLIETYFVKKNGTKTVWEVVDKRETEIIFFEYMDLINKLSSLKSFSGGMVVRKKDGRINKIFFNDVEKQNKTIFEIIFNN
jgi:hypothetical protein